MTWVGLFWLIFFMSPWLYIFLQVIFIRVFVYWYSYIYVRISYKENHYIRAKELIRMKDELRALEFDEARLMVSLYFGTGIKGYCNPVQKEKLILKIKAYENAIRRSER